MKMMNPELLKEGNLSTGNEEFDNFDVEGVLNEENLILEGED